MKKLIGIFGGTFDPVHLGHLNAVSQLCGQVDFDRVHWVLSARPPHKNSTSASIRQRFEMLQAALHEYPEYLADDCEIVRQEKSFTIDTVLSFRQLYPRHTPCLIVGSDSLLKLHTWHRYRELVEQTHIIVMTRPGYQMELSKSLAARQLDSLDELTASPEAGLVIFPHTDYDVSSTQVRLQIAEEWASGWTQQSRSRLEKLLPPSVIDYIHDQQSYKIPPLNLEKKMKPEQIRNQVVAAIEDIKGIDIRVIDIADISDFADYMIVASGTSVTHVKALAREASNKLRKQGVIPLGENGADIGEWVLVDFGDVVLHVMRPEVREYYDLEKLWDEDVRELVKQHREQQES